MKNKRREQMMNKTEHKRGGSITDRREWKARRGGGIRRNNKE